MDNRVNFQRLLKDLARDDITTNPNDVNEYIGRLQGIYKDRFRHYYSDIFGVISLLDASALNNLQGNIRVLYDVVNDNREIKKDFRKSIQKLYDHVNLDIARIQYSESLAKQWSKKNSNLANQIEELTNKAENMQKDYITILGIFSSIVIAFVAGLAFSSSVLNNIEKASIYRLIFVIAAIAFILFNLISMLTEFIRSVQNNGQTLPIREGQSAIDTVNAILFIVLIIDVSCWLFYWWRFS